MKAMILAAGLGTRLRPWTLHHPKALVPVGGVPMLERVTSRLISSNFKLIVINVHHFSSQIIEFLQARHFDAEILISDESDRLMDTGGGIVHASELLGRDSSPFLIHNVDILSNADLRALMDCHIKTDSDATLLVSNRSSSRKLLVDHDMNLKGWHNLKTGEYRPKNLVSVGGLSEVAFSGIHVMNMDLIGSMENIFGREPFPVMDFYLDHAGDHRFCTLLSPNLELIDIGKPETLETAEKLF